MNQTSVAMAQLSVVILIDVEAVNKTNTLAGNIYFIDNNEWNGSTNEGTEHLVTAIAGTQVINWLCLGIDVIPSETQPIPGWPVIVKIEGEAVEKHVMIPDQFMSPDFTTDGRYWSATVDSNTEGRYAYTLHFDIGGKFMDFTSYIDVKRGFSNVPRSYRLL